MIWVGLNVLIFVVEYEEVSLDEYDEIEAEKKDSDQVRIWERRAARSFLNSALFLTVW